MSEELDKVVTITIDEPSKVEEVKPVESKRTLIQRVLNRKSKIQNVKSEDEK